MNTEKLVTVVAGTKDRISFRFPKTSRKRMLWPTLGAAIFICAACSDQLDSETSQKTMQIPDEISETKPNFLVILADDLAISDLGSFGGEIETTNLNRLAETGVTLTNFYATPMCAPTRASLLTGMNPHAAGIGAMYEVVFGNFGPNAHLLTSHEGYETYLSESAVTIPEVLKLSGYRTFMAGKWHIGQEPEQSPAARGFDQSFALINGGAGHFDDLAMLPISETVYRDGYEVTELPDDFYSTHFFTDRLIEYIDADRDSGEPFFAYLAYTAPHWPLQAPEATIKKYEERYLGGYDELRGQRIAAMEQLGLIPENSTRSPRIEGEFSWDELSEVQQRYEARRMAVYAAMIDEMDQYIGKLVKYLESIGELDNTYIFFMSDNGSEGADVATDIPFRTIQTWYDDCCDNSYENMGRGDSYIWIDESWGQAHTGPYRMYKSFTSEGGIRVPGIAWSGRGDFPNVTNSSFAGVADIMPTILELAGAQHPAPAFQGREVRDMQGISLAPMLMGETASAYPDNFEFAWELHGSKAYRRGNYKILLQTDDQQSTGEWQLYDLDNDPAESRDLAREAPDLLAELVAGYEAYALRTGILDYDALLELSQQMESESAAESL